MTTRKKPRAKPLRYFFYNGDLHKKIHISRGDDLISAWNYPQGKMVKYVYSLVKRDGEKAFSTSQVAGMFDRTRDNIWNHVSAGNVKLPQYIYGLDENRNLYTYMWSEKDIMDLHDFLKTVHIGRPRADGRISTGKLPTAAELRAMIRQGTVLYVKDSDGNFVPTWRAENI